MVVQRHPELSDDVGIRRAAQIVAGKHAVACFAGLLDHTQLQQFLQKRAMRQVARVALEQRFDTAKLAVEREDRWPSGLVEELGINVPAGQHLRNPACRRCGGRRVSPTSTSRTRVTSRRDNPVIMATRELFVGRPWMP